MELDSILVLSRTEGRSRWFLWQGARSTPLIDKVRYAWPEGRQSLRRQTVRVYVALALVEFLLVLPQAPRIVTLQSETRTRARWWNLKLVDDFLPELVRSDALKTAPQDCGLEQLAKVQLFTADLGHLEVFHAQVFLELDQFVFELAALALLVLII